MSLFLNRKVLSPSEHEIYDLIILGPLPAASYSNQGALQCHRPQSSKFTRRWPLLGRGEERRPGWVFHAVLSLADNWNGELMKGSLPKKVKSGN